MEDEKVYMFKAALKHRKKSWFYIEIMGNQTLGDFDYIMREAFKHDIWDHLSEFFSGRAWKSKGYGEIDPDGGGSGSKKLIYQLALSEGDKLEYVYDFGDDIQHVITLESIAEPENEVEYPRIISRNKTR
ncbi:MAG: plasmid pRiA4b ORF-3 family protein [ANME-2 cluster archaeon]|nr:plasmid pRiA4b ORF-3 family protein [ANME-2 cluster archaeon]